MLTLKYSLLSIALCLFIVSASMLTYDVWCYWMTYRLNRTSAEAAAQAKLIDSRAEMERQNLMAQAEESRVRLMAGADAERMRAEAQVLKDNPLLIQKIIAEKLSDKVQIMMVPMDGKFFFANDVLRGTGISALNPPQK